MRLYAPDRIHYVPSVMVWISPILFLFLFPFSGVFKKSELQHHLDSAHAIVTCACGYESDKMKLGDHQDTSCPLRLVLCELCGLQVVSKDKQSHLIACGSKTIECNYCHKYIQTKLYESHLATCQRNPALEKKQLFVCLFCQGKTIPLPTSV